MTEKKKLLVVGFGGAGSQIAAKVAASKVTRFLASPVNVDWTTKLNLWLEVAL